MKEEEIKRAIEKRLIVSEGEFITIFRVDYREVFMI